MSDALSQFDRNTRRMLLRAESVRRASGDWGPWEHIDIPHGVPGGHGWNLDVRWLRKNKVFSVLMRPIEGVGMHLAVSSLSGNRPSWHEMQRIKNEILGESVIAVEIYPPADQVVDQADMFHICSVQSAPFTIFEGSHS